MSFVGLWVARNNLVFQNKKFVMEMMSDLHILCIVWCPDKVIDFAQNFVDIRVKKSKRRRVID